MRALAVVATLMASSMIVAPSTADDEDRKRCEATSTFQQAVNHCEYSSEEIQDFHASGDGHVYSIAPACAVGGEATCSDDALCAHDGKPGKWFRVFRDDEMIGTTCLTEQEVESLGHVTPALVLKAFQRLTWPRSELVLQPPDGVTLVGFETNFYTTNTTPTTQTVTLLGRRIQLEATPTSYAWQFGDATSETTQTPGAAYPDLLVTHQYQHSGLVRPSVDTVYAGRFRVGTGPWQTIPGTLTVAGRAAELEVREARGVLVGN